VLHLIPSLEVGGTEGQLVEFIRRSSNPERHFVAVSWKAGPLARDLPNPAIVLGAGPRMVDIVADLRALSTFRHAVRDVQAEIVQTYLHLSELIAFLATPPGVPIIATRRGPRGRYESGGIFRRLEGLAHRRTRVLICNSEYLARLVRLGDRTPPPIEIIYNAVDTHRYDVVPFARGRPTVTVVANLHPYKGHTKLLYAMRSVLASVPEARMVFVGDGVERARLEHLTRELGLQDAVVFVGSVEDPRPFVRDAHVVALASDHEGFPNALLEAMAMGRPVVATRTGGIPELVRDGEDGLLTGVDPSDIAGRLIEILRDADLRERLGSSARTRAETFGWDRLIRETEAVYRSVLPVAR
jgi:glycosyltransferase involved in cell wall biosynthesis